MKTKKKAEDLKDQSQWEYREKIVATYHFELPKMTALMSAALKGRLKMVKFLLLFQKKENIFLKDDNGDTALDYSILGGNIEIIKLLLSKGLNVDGTVDGRWSPLMSAVNDAYSGKTFRNGREEIIKFLLNNKASVNYQDENGKTALMLAIDGETTLMEVVENSCDLFNNSERPNLEIIKLLIETGADVNLKNSDGETALDIAKSYEKQAVIDYLIANGAKGKDNRDDELFNTWLKLHDKYRQAKKNKDLKEIINSCEQIIELDLKAKSIKIMVPIFQKEIGDAYAKLGNNKLAKSYYLYAIEGFKKKRESPLNKPDDWLKDIEVLQNKINKLV